MKKCLLFAPLLFVASLAIAQDSLVSLKEITYSSEFEKKAFNEFFVKNNFQALPLMLALNAGMNEEKEKSIDSRIQSIVGSIEASGIEKKKADKKIKTIYEKVHNPLLKKYELENRFHEIFTSGNYNCVTATALYALVFDALGIPYEIREEPTHVYLLGYPNKENILVETTSPLFGYINFNPEFKERYVSNLKKQKLIGNDEDDKTNDELFNKYYFKNSKITLHELVGIHYMNDALFQKDHNNNKESFYQLEKSYLFYPSKRCRYLLMLMGAEVVSKEKLSPKEKMVFVGKLSRFGSEGITADMIKGEFNNLTQELLFRDNNRPLYNDCYQTLIKAINDKELAGEINYIYNYENGRAYYHLGNYQKAKPYFEKALALQPNNLDLGGIFIGALAQSLRHMDESKMVLDTLTHYKEKYPSLAQYNNFNSMLINATIAQYGEAFKTNNLEKAKMMKDAMDKLIKENPNMNMDYNIVGEAFSNAGSYYFKKGQKAKAKELLQEGLKLSPDNFQLRTRMQMIR